MRETWGRQWVCCNHEMHAYLFYVFGHLGQDGWDGSTLTLGVSSRESHARIITSTSRALRPRGLELGTARGFLSDVIMTGDR